MEIATQAVEAIGAGDEEGARSLLNTHYPSLKPDLAPGKQLHWMASFFYELDEYLSDPEARRRAGLTPGLIISSYSDLRREAEDTVDQ